MYNSSVSPFSSFLDTVELSARGQTERLCNSTQSRSLSSRLGGTNMLLVRDLIRTKTKWTLLQLLNQSSFLQTTDPRDKVYGLLGLAADAEYYPNPDYTKSVQDVYVEFGLSSVEKRFTDLELHLMNVTEEAIRETVTDSVKKDEMSAIYRRKAYESFPGQQCPTVNLLKHAGLHKQTLRLPSWIPDWSHRHFPASMNSFVSSIWINDDCLIIHEAAVSEPKYGVRAEQREGGPALLLQGKLLHSIMKISDTAPGIEEQHYWASLGQWTKTCESLIREHLEIVTEHAMDLEVLTRYSKVLSVNLSSHPRTTLKASEVLKGKELRGYQLMSSGLATSEPTDPKLESAYTNIVTCMTPCRRFCITTDGKFGLVPSAAKVGDRIAMLDGIACPMILRELCSLATPCWTLVGDSFIEDHDACSPFRFTRDLPNLPFPHSFCISFDSKPPKPPGVEELVLL